MTLPHEAPQQDGPPRDKALRNTILILVILIIITGSEAVFFFWMNNPPRMDRAPRTQSRGLLVEIELVNVGSRQAKIEAMGTVLPARRVTLAPLVGGELIERAPALMPGGRFKEGDVVARIDPEDYSIEVKGRRAVLERAKGTVTRTIAEQTRAESDLLLEEGRCELAREESTLLDGEIPGKDLDLVLRKPQLRAAEARVDAAGAARKEAEETAEAAAAALEQAQLDERRTEVKAPFDAVVVERLAEEGARLSGGTPLAELVGTARFWIELSLPMDALKWIDIPDSTDGEGSEVRIFDEAAWGPGRFRTGRVRSLVPELESEGRMARIIVSVEDPLALEKSGERERPRLTLGSYVRGIITGHTLEDVAVIPRHALREGNTVWVMNDENRLDIREVDRVRDSRETALVRGLQQGERIVLSGIATPVRDMLLREPDSQDEKTAGTDEPEKGKGTEE